MSDSFVTPWTVVLQAPLSVVCPRQDYWSGLSFPSPGDPPDPGIEPTSPALAGRILTTESSGKPFLGFLDISVFFWLCGMWDPSSLTKDQTCAPCNGNSEF